MKEPNLLSALAPRLRQKTRTPNNNNNTGTSTHHVRCQPGTFEGLLAVYVVQGSSARGDAWGTKRGVMP